MPVNEGHNAVHASPDGTLIAKVYGERSRCDVEVAAATLARAAGVCVPDLIERPHERVAVWRRVLRVAEAPGASAIVRLAHDLDRLSWLPAAAAPVNWLVNIEARAQALESRADWGDPDVAWLVAELRAVLGSAAALGAPVAFQHGDLTAANLVHDGRRLHIIDFETVRAAPREWDVATLTVSAQRYDGFASDALQRVVGALSPPPEPTVLACCVRAKELLNSSWLYLIRGRDRALVAEAGRRVGSLRDGRRHRWQDLAALAPAQPT